MGNFSLSERFQYWLDKKMAKGTVSMIRVLVTATVVFVMSVAVLMFLFNLNDGENFISVFWDIFVTTIDEEWPRSEDGKLGYIILTGISAAVGLLFTSVLIGIITSAIEGHIEEMKKGTTMILEKDHIVILGFTPGEYSLISEVVESFGEERGTIIVAENMERETMEDLIYENVKIPERIDLVCRSIDIQDPSELKRCSPLWAKTIIVAPLENNRVLKTAVAAEAVLSEKPECSTKIIATVDSSKYVIQRYMSENRHLIMLQTNDLVARLIAHCSTQPGLSGVYNDIFNYAGCEFYEEEVPWSIGKQFGEIVQMARGGSVVGISNKQGIKLNPDPTLRLKADDNLVYFAENKGDLYLEETYEYSSPTRKAYPAPVGEKNLVIIGYNSTLPTILHELPERSFQVKIITDHLEEANKAISSIKYRGEIKASADNIDLSDITALEGVVSPMDYVVLLSNRELEDDPADIEIMLFLFKLYDIRDRLQLDFSVTAEMRREKNRSLIFLKRPTDFVIASNISSMIMAQIAYNPRMRYLFTELLSNKGSEIYLRYASSLDCDGERITIREIRHRAIEYGYLVMGYMRKEKGENKLYMNPDANQVITLRPEDHLVVIGRK